VTGANCPRGWRTGARSLALLVVLCLAACSPDRAIEAVKILGDLHAGAGQSWLKDSTPAPERGTVAYSIDGRSRTGDLYRPGRPPSVALVLVPGAAAAGKDDPRLVAFATTLARARFLVLVPDVAGLRQLRVRAADAREIADAVRWVSTGATGPTDHPVGIAAISFALGPAVLAALEPDVRDRVRFILGVGAYYDLTAVITYVTTGSFRDRGSAEWRRERPNPYGAWLFALTNADRLPDAGDRALVSEMANRMLADPAYDSFDLQHHSYLTRGLYLDQLLHWEEHLPRQQMLVIGAEEFFAEPERVFAEVLEFLELPAWKLAGYEQHNARSYAPMSPRMRARLEEFFRDPNRRLFEHLGRAFAWGS